MRKKQKTFFFLKKLPLKKLPKKNFRFLFFPSFSPPFLFFLSFLSVDVVLERFLWFQKVSFFFEEKEYNNTAATAVTYGFLVVPPMEGQPHHPDASPSSLA